MKSIIVYLSPIEHALNIVDYSAQVAQRLDLNIHFVYNVEIDAETEKKNKNKTKDELVDKLIEKKKLEIGEIVEKYDWKNSNITAAYSIYSGSQKEMFKTLAEKNNADWILFPVEKKETSVSKLIARIQNIINIPFWCFPADKKFRPIKTIVYGSDYKKDDINTIKSLAVLAKSFQAKINILHIYKSKKFKQRIIDVGLKHMIDNKIEYPSIEIHSKKKNRVVTGIASFCKSSYADMVVLMKKEKFFSLNILGKSKIDKVIKKIDLPVIIYRK